MERVAVVLLMIWSLAGCTRRHEPYRVPVADPAARRTLPAGEIVGGDGRYGAQAWLGIPYAQPPVGELRWRAPQPLPRWTGVREALEFGAPCAQYGSRFAGIDAVGPDTPAGSEDCLTLNVFTPRYEPAAVPQGSGRLPVMVWIHGGGNSIGLASFYEPGRLVMSQGVVVVTVQYRLGPFGWFRHAALRAHAGNDLERSGNFGTLDLVRALGWVRDNIAAFGGDPGNVTVFGESAGGRNVFSLLLSPPARGLFHRAIAQSGGPWLGTVDDAERATDDPVPGHAQSSTEIALRLLQKDGKATDRTIAKAALVGMAPDRLAAYLRAKPATEILAAYQPSPSGMIDLPQVFGDGAVLPADDPCARFARADGWNRVPVMLGTNRDENALFLFADPERVHRLLGVLPRLTDATWYRVSVEYQARLWKATGVDEPAAAMRAVSDKVFAYRFDWDEEPTVMGADLSKMLGAAHGFEIPFVFGHFDLGREANAIFTAANEPGRLELSRAMMAYWGAFARDGAPVRGGAANLPAWVAWDASSPDRPKYLVLDTAAGGGPRMANATESRTGLLAALRDDARLATPRDRCRILRELAERGRGLARAEYDREAGCASFPFDRYPWAD